MLHLYYGYNLRVIQIWLHLYAYIQRLLTISIITFMSFNPNIKNYLNKNRIHIYTYIIYLDFQIACSWHVYQVIIYLQSRVSHKKFNTLLICHGFRSQSTVRNINYFSFARLSIRVKLSDNDTNIYLRDDWDT